MVSTSTTGPNSKTETIKPIKKMIAQMSGRMKEEAPESVAETFSYGSAACCEAWLRLAVATLITSGCAPGPGSAPLKLSI